MKVTIMRLTKKLYKLEISVKIVERSSYSDKIPEIAFSVRENIPTGTHPVDYLRQRLSEEVRRHASQTTLETKTEIASSGEI